MLMKRILVIVNKNWETEPVLNALTHPKLRPEELLFPEIVNTPRDADNRMSQPRALFSLGGAGKERLEIMVRCIEDLMATGVNTSSSLEKYQVLPPVIAEDAADLIISVSTANYPYTEPGDVPVAPDWLESHNGSVVLGGNFFIHDGASPDADPDTKLKHPAVGTFIASNVNSELFQLAESVTVRLSPGGKPKMIPPPHAPSPHLKCIGDAGYSAISSVNVTDYNAYDTIDSEALGEFYRKAPAHCTPNSIETTHGVVKICTREEPILFLSPITDRLNHFNDDVTDAQNYVAAFNGGLVLGELLCLLNDFVQQGKTFESEKKQK